MSKMSNIKRLYGLDLFRGLAVYAVILVHADEGISKIPLGWDAVLKFAEFGVPFFLAGSFFLSAKKLYSEKPYPLLNRIRRLAIPYLFWTLLYLIYKLAKYKIDGDLEQLNLLLAHPMEIIFFGGAAFHLYFIPLLIAGTLLLKYFDLAKVKSLSRAKLLSLWILSIILYQIILSSNNQFDLASLSAFKPMLAMLSSNIIGFPLIKIIAVELAWTLRCLPYLLSAVLLYQYKIEQKIQRLNFNQISILILAFCLINGVGYLIIPEALQEIMRGYSAIIAAIAISGLLKENKWITSMGTCSFGIYLMHLIVLDFFKIASNRLDFLNLTSPSIFTLLLITTCSFIIPWILSSYLMQSKSLSKLIFGY